MNPRILIVIALAIISGLSAVFLVQALRTQPRVVERTKEVPVPAKIERVKVAVAVATIPPGQEVVAAMFELREVPKEGLPKDVLTDPKQLLGQVAQQRINKDDVIRQVALMKDERKKVVRAIKPVQAGQKIGPNMVEIVDLPKEGLTDDVLTDDGNAIGRVAAQRINAGDVIRQVFFDQAQHAVAMPGRLGENMRAFTIHTPSFTSNVAGHALPDSRVDVLLSVNANAPKDDQKITVEARGPVAVVAPKDDEKVTVLHTSILLQDVRILAAHTEVAEPPDSRFAPKQIESVTLEVTAQQASQLDYAQTQGTLHLSLRADGDRAVVQDEPVMRDDFLSPGPRRYPVVVAKQTISLGEPTTNGNLDVILVDKFHRVRLGQDCFENINDAANLFARFRIARGRIISPKDLNDERIGLGLMKDRIAPGKRAFTIQTSSLPSNVAGHLVPEDRVDVLLNLDQATSSAIGGNPLAMARTSTLVQNAKVLAAHTETVVPADGKFDPLQVGSVTLEVTPEEVSVLDQGMSQGTLHLSIRSDGDDKIITKARSAIFLPLMTLRGTRRGHAIYFQNDVAPAPRPADPDQPFLPSEQH